MGLAVSCLVFLLGLGLVIYAAEKLVLGTVGVSWSFGLSTFVISVLFIGFDPENLAVGAMGAYEGVYGIALGSIVGAAMVVVALAFGLTALISPMTFERTSKGVLALPVAAVALFGVLGLDGKLSRVDGLLLLFGFALSVGTIIVLSKKGAGIEPSKEVAEGLKEAERMGTLKALGVFIFALVGIVAGSGMLVSASKTILASLRISDTVFGMIILSFLVSTEELARELPAALKGRPEIAYGNVAGSILAFFLFNAGVIALVHPVRINRQIMTHYLPVCFLAVLSGTLFMAGKRVGRAQGALLVFLYLLFVGLGLGKGGG